MKALRLTVILFIAVAMLNLPVFGETRLALNIQGFVTPEQNFYFHLNQLTDPSTTNGMLGYANDVQIPGGSALAMLWLAADDDGDIHLGPGFWPTWNLTDRLDFTVDASYLIGFGDAENELNIVPWLQYRVDERNSLRLQGGYTDVCKEDSLPWLLGPIWIYHLTESNQIRLGYQQELTSDPESRVILSYAINL